MEFDVYTHILFWLVSRADHFKILLYIGLLGQYFAFEGEFHATI